jgi:hypothetical protein
MAARAGARLKGVMMFRSQRPAPLSLAVQAASMAALVAMLVLEWRAHPSPAAQCLAPVAAAHALRGAAPAPCGCSHPPHAPLAGAAAPLQSCSPSGAAS